MSHSSPSYLTDRRRRLAAAVAARSPLTLTRLTLTTNLNSRARGGWQEGDVGTALALTRRSICSPVDGGLQDKTGVSLIA